MEKRKAKMATLFISLLMLGNTVFATPASALAPKVTGIMETPAEIKHLSKVKSAPVTKTHVPTRTGKVSPKTSKAYARYKAEYKYNWGSTQFKCLSSLWQAESGWNHRADNPHSGAYGIPQSLPGNKMAQAGSDWRTNPETQINWGLSYINSRYGTPCSAYKHFTRYNWY